MLVGLHVAVIVKFIGAYVVVVVVVVGYNVLPSPIISIVAAEVFDIELVVASVPCASNNIERTRESINCLGGVSPSHSVHCTYE